MHMRTMPTDSSHARRRVPKGGVLHHDPTYRQAGRQRKRHGGQRKRRGAQRAAGAQYRSLNGGDSVEQCNHGDVCWCVGNGLLPGGVREGYCLLLYLNSSGRPTN